jgi:hypothetical protein
VPWQRVVYKDGGLAFGDRQYALLQAEGVVFTAEEKVDMALCRWTQEEAEESLWW